MPSTVIEPQRTVPIRSEADVVVVGGGPAGTAAATAAARLGARTVLIEQSGYLGGMATGGMVCMIHSMSDGTRNRQIQGIAQEWIDQMTTLNGTMMIKEQDLGSTDKDVQLSQGILPRHGAMFFWPNGNLLYGGRFDPEILKHVLAQMVKNAGVKLHLHSLGTRPILENGDVKGVYFECVEGTQAILAKTVIDCTGDGTIFNAAGAESTTETSGQTRIDKHALTFDFANVDIPRADRFREEHKEEYDALMAEVSAQNGFTLFFKTIPQRPGVVHFNMFLKGYSTLRVDDLTDIQVSVRERMMTTFQFYKEKLPGFENAFIMVSAPQIGARGSRRIIGEYTYTEKDAKSGVVFDDAIAEWPGLSGNYPQAPHVFLPLRTLIPKKPIEGILCAGRCFSSDETVNAHYNTISHCIAMGQAAGTASALAAQQNKTVRTVDPKLVQKSLAAQGVPLPSLAL